MKKRSLNVFFPWERRRSWLGAVGRARLRNVVLVCLALGSFFLLRAREDHAAERRATRAAITSAYHATLAYRADHRGACPRDVGELQSGGYTYEVPTDAWGKPLRIVCPGRKDPKGFELLSDGPDGLPFGLDRVE